MPTEPRLPPAVHHTDLVPAGCPLSNRELQTMVLRGKGMQYKEVAAELGVSHASVRLFIHRGLARLGALDSAEAVKILGENGWLGFRGEPPWTQSDSREAYTVVWERAIREAPPKEILPVLLRMMLMNREASIEEVDQLKRGLMARLRPRPSSS